MTQNRLHVSLEAGEQDAPCAAYLLAKHGVFSPERSLMRGYGLDNRPGQQYRDVYYEAHARRARLAAHFVHLPVPALLHAEALSCNSCRKPMPYWRNCCRETAGI